MSAGRRAHPGCWLGAVVVVISAPLGAQSRTTDPLQRILSHPAVASALGLVGQSEARAVSTLIELASIVSPSGREHERAGAVAAQMRRIGLSAVTVDSIPNVVGVIPGTSGRALLFITMLDDLPVIERFQREGTARPRREGDRVVGSATELQSNVAAMLVAAEALVKAGVRPFHDLVFAGVAREETGLQGMEKLYQRYRSRAVGFVEVLGDGRRIEYGAGGAVAWWRVIARGPEGHTEEGGLPNVNQAIARAVDAILSLPYPERFRDRHTKINVGILRSGEVFNHKPASGWFSVDVRSRDRPVVEMIGQDIRSILQRVAGETGISLAMEPDFQSLGGQIPGARDSLLTRAAVAASRYLGFEPELSDLGCCNMRVALAGGSLAVGIHGEGGGARGTAEEWASVPSLLNAARHVVLMAAALGTPHSP